VNRADGAMMVLQDLLMADGGSKMGLQHGVMRALEDGILGMLDSAAYGGGAPRIGLRCWGARRGERER
jgi:hypothetical protein